MTELFYMLSRYSADKIIFAALSIPAVLAVKKLLPGIGAKLSAALPFICGALLYCAWGALCGPRGEEIISGATAVGGLSAIFNAFISPSGEKTASVLASFVPCDKVEAAEKECRAAIEKGEDVVEEIEKILAKYSSLPGIELELAARTVLMLLSSNK